MNEEKAEKKLKAEKAESEKNMMEEKVERN